MNIEKIVISLKGNLEEIAIKEGVSMDSILDSLAHDLNNIKRDTKHPEITEIYIEDSLGKDEVVVHVLGCFTNYRQGENMRQEEYEECLHQDIQEAVSFYGLTATIIDELTFKCIVCGEMFDDINTHLQQHDDTAHQDYARKIRDEKFKSETERPKCFCGGQIRLFSHGDPEDGGYSVECVAKGCGYIAEED
jgi:RNase H-fold protein (predicted Holliday junction resolvase)